MKKIYAIFFLLMASLYAHSTIHTILVADFSFIPSSVNANCGDTVAWVWSNGTHTTTSASVPSCVAPWNAPITSSISTFSVVVACEGIYNYYCTVHPQMTGNIVVACATGITEASLPASLLAPNPFLETITVTYQDKDRVVLYDMLGNAVKDIKLAPGSNSIQLNLADLPRGIYFLGMLRRGVITEIRKISKE